MPAPAAPTSFTLTPGSSGDPTVTLTWSHSGTDLDRFEILRRPISGTTWDSVVLAPKADFGTGPYSFVTASRPDTQWAVRALNAAGEVSV